jgi:hypothetical protein
MEQVNEVVNNVAACLGTVLPLEEASETDSVDNSFREDVEGTGKR